MIKGKVILQHVIILSAPDNNKLYTHIFLSLAAFGTGVYVLVTVINIYFAYFVNKNVYIPSKREIHHQWTRTCMLCKISNAVVYYFFCLAQYQN